MRPQSTRRGDGRHGARRKLVTSLAAAVTPSVARSTRGPVAEMAVKFERL